MKNIKIPNASTGNATVLSGNVRMTSCILAKMGKFSTHVKKVVLMNRFIK
jgi:hypothetical protein